MAWEVLCRPKDRGSVGLKRAQEMSKALLAKLAWRVGLQSNETWARVIRNKYGLTEDGPLQFNLKHKSSLIWKGVV